MECVKSRLPSVRSGEIDSENIPKSFHFAHIARHFRCVDYCSHYRQQANEQQMDILGLAISEVHLGVPRIDFAYQTVSSRQLLMLPTVLLFICSIRCDHAIRCDCI